MPLRSAGELADAPGGVLDRAQAAGGVAGERPAGLGRHDAAARAHEQVGAERLLELADLLGDGGLGDAQRLGGGRERPSSSAAQKQRICCRDKSSAFGLRQATKPTLASSRRADDGRHDSRRGHRRRRHRRALAPPGGCATATSCCSRRATGSAAACAPTPCGDYWLNYGAHLFPAPGSLVDGMARDCGLETVPVTGGMMGLARRLHAAQRRPRRDLPVPAAALAPRPGRLRQGRAQGPARRRPLPPARGRRFDFEDHRTFGEFLGPLPPAVARHLLLRRAPRDRRARRALGRLRHRAVRARLGRQGLADRAQPARRQRAAARGARPRARRARAHGRPRATRIRPDGDDLVVSRRRRGDPRAPRHRRRAGAARRAARRARRGAGRATRWRS